MWALISFDGTDSQWRCDGCQLHVDAKDKRPEPCKCGLGTPEDDSVVKYYANVGGQFTQVATIQRAKD